MAQAKLITFGSLDMLTRLGLCTSQRLVT